MLDSIKSSVISFPLTVIVVGCEFEKAFELMPEIGEIYKSNGWEMGVFFLNDATAEIRNMFAIEESCEFKY